MAIKFCPKCMNIIKKKDEKCSKCGMLVCDMESYAENEKVQLEETITNKQENSDNVATADEIATQNKPKRHKHKKKTKDVPHYTVDEDGSFNIDTRDVTFLDNSSYSSKKERGEFKPEKIEWWEIYKWADRVLARRKIMKEVNKAAKEKPSFVKKSAMILWCLFFGWMGAHNYYAKNYIRGIVTSVAITMSLIFISVPALASVAVFFGGGAGFVAVYIWFGDLISILLNSYKYRISKEAFIAKLNVETRYKISKKYLTLDKIKAEQEKIKEKQRKKLEKKEAKLSAKKSK